MQDETKYLIGSYGHRWVYHVSNRTSMNQSKSQQLSLSLLASAPTATDVSLGLHVLT